MGRDKGIKGEAKGGGNKAADAQPNSSDCPLCQQPVVSADETYIAGHCTECGRRPYHVPCIQTYLEKKLFKEIREGGSGTKSIEKVKMKIAQRPQELMYKNGGAQRLQQHCPACQTGILECADVEKPPKKTAPPLPPPAPRLPRGQPAAAVAGAVKKAASATDKPAAGAAPRAVCGSRLASTLSKASSFSSTNSASGDWLPRRSAAPDPIPNRPVWLQMCRDTLDGGDCYTYRCPFCHSYEEQEERERQYWEDQKEAARKRRLRELEEHKRQQEVAAQAAAAEAAAKVEEARRQEERRAALRREVVIREEAALQLSDDALQLLKRHKRSLCIATLTEMGFGADAAAAAADAAGCEPTAAAVLMTDGGASGGSAPAVSVIREARQLLTEAANLGLSPPAVEAALQAAAGNWDRARRELQQAAQAQAALAQAAAHATSAASASTGLDGGLSRQTSVASSSTAVSTAAYGGQPAAWGATSSGWQADVGVGAATAPALHPGFDAGFAAGLAAAAAADPHIAAAADPWAQQAEQQDYAGWSGAVPPPEMDRQPAPEEEVDEYLAMLGITG